MKISPAFFLPLLIFAVIVIIAAIALKVTLSGDRQIAALPSALIGQFVPETELPALDASQQFLTLPAQANRPYLVNFFASWCAPCRAEAPALAQLANQIDIYGIAYKDKSEDAQLFLKDYGNPFKHVGLDQNGQAGLNWGVYGVPETYLISASGMVLMRHAGPIDIEAMHNIIEPAIAEALALDAQ